jgi:hypothetical protein
MIIIHVMGGLGNQLYQYALYEKLKSIGKEVKLDLYAYKTATGDEREQRSLELDLLDGLEYDVCTPGERTLFLDNSMKLISRVRRKLFGRKSRQVDEKGEYMPEIFDMDNVYLYGFWGCERYYEDIIPLLQEKIKFPISGNPRNLETMEKMEKENSVSIHLRRQDYLTVADGKRYMGICTDEYYKAAMEYIKQRIDNPVFYIFSDDTKYAKANFKGENMYVADWNIDTDSLYDMELMSHCKHNICANSTFSIWGARLNKNPDKLMIRPLKHDNYEQPDTETAHINWKNWIIIDEYGRLR